MIRRFKVTEKLIELLDNCCPNKVMKEMGKMNFLTMTAKPFFQKGTQHKLNFNLCFEEIPFGYWAYTEDFYEELCKNEVEIDKLNLE